MFRSALIAIATLALAGPAWSEHMTWTTVAKAKKGKQSRGDIQMAFAAGGENIAVFFAGYNVDAQQTRSWAEGMFFWAEPKLSEFAVAAVYSVPGPMNSMYTGSTREHALDVLAKSIGETASKLKSRLIIVAAHSSGAFVADAALAEFARQNPALLSRVVYYKLDGGWAELTAPVMKKMAAVYCVSANCGTTRDAKGKTVPLRSRNAGAMDGCGAKSGGKAQLVVYKTLLSGCKTSDCCHDTLINVRPQKPTTFTPADYTFSGKSMPNGDWLDTTRIKLKGMTGY